MLPGPKNPLQEQKLVHNIDWQITESFPVTAIPYGIRPLAYDLSQRCVSNLQILNHHRIKGERSKSIQFDLVIGVIQFEAYIDKQQQQLTTYKWWANANEQIPPRSKLKGGAQAQQCSERMKTKFPDVCEAAIAIQATNGFNVFLFHFPNLEHETIMVQVFINGVHVFCFGETLTPQDITAIRNWTYKTR